MNGQRQLVTLLRRFVSDLVDAAKPSRSLSVSKHTQVQSSVAILAPKEDTINPVALPQPLNLPASKAGTASSGSRASISHAGRGEFAGMLGIQGIWSVEADVTRNQSHASEFCGGSAGDSS